MAYRVYNPDGISKTLAAVGGGAGAKTGLYAVKVLKPYGSTGGVCGLKITENETGVALLDKNIRIRRLTPRECWRLQGFPDEYFDKAKAGYTAQRKKRKQPCPA